MSDLYLPAYPDEFAWGYDGRVLRQMGEEPSDTPKYREIARWLYMKRAAYRTHSSARGLQMLAPVANLTYQEMIHRHTLAPALCTFTERKNAATFDCSPKRFSRYALQLAGGAPQLCPKCVADDKAKHGQSYWHRFHQLPGISHCPVHREPLWTVGGAPVVFLQSPERALDRGGATKLPFSLRAVEARLAALWQGLLPLNKPIHFQEAARLIKAGVARNHIYSVSEAGRDSVTKKLLAEADAGWVKRYFGEPDRLAATARNSDPMAAKWYTLALALLYESPADALFFLTGERSSQVKALLNGTARIDQVRNALGAYAAGMPFTQARELAGGAAADHFEASLRALARAAVQAPAGV